MINNIASIYVDVITYPYLKHKGDLRNLCRKSGPMYFRIQHNFYQHDSVIKLLIIYEYFKEKLTSNVTLIKTVL